MNDKKVMYFVLAGLITIVGMVFISREILIKRTRVSFTPVTRASQVEQNLLNPKTEAVQNQQESKAAPVRQAPSSLETTPSTSAHPFNGNAFREQKLIASMESPLDAEQNLYKRVSIFKTDFKYPLVRIVETLKKDPITGQQVVLDQKEMAADHLIVKLKQGISKDVLQLIAKRYNAEILKEMAAPNTFIVKFQSTDTEALPRMLTSFSQELAAVSYVDTDYIVYSGATPNDPSFGIMWNLHNTGQTGGISDRDIDAPEAWGVTTGTNSVKVAIIDTGVDYTHPDLAANIWTNTKEIPNNGIDDDGNGYIDDVHGYDFYNYDGDPMDDYFHGTHCAGTIGAVGNNAKGVTGVAWKVTMMPIKFLNQDGAGIISDAVDAVYYATKMGVKLTSNSWTGGGFVQALQDAINDANTHNVLFVVAAGNDGLDIDKTPAYPANYPCANLIAVAASDEFGHIASFSNYGIANVDIAAPGSNIYSTFPVIPTAAMTAYGFDGSYGYLSGTSMATPHVSGVLALVFTKYPTTTAAQAKARLKARSVHWSSLVSKVNFASNLNAYDAVNPNWKDAPVLITTTYNGMTDPEGNKNNQANPGEIIQIKSNFINLGTLTLPAATLDVTTTNLLVQKLTTGPINMGNLIGVNRFGMPSAFRFKLSTTLKVGTVVPFNYIFKGTNGVTQTLTYQMTVK
jgi:subtilisin family serine protease